MLVIYDVIELIEAQNFHPHGLNHSECVGINERSLIRIPEAYYTV
jgi:hypothetical protein